MKSVRLPHYDYGTSGAYFLTLRTHEKVCLLGVIADGIMRPSEFGQLVKREWERSGEVRKEINIDEFVVMPSHLHGIVWITEDDRAHCRAALPDGYTRGSQDREPRSISSFVAGFK